MNQMLLGLVPHSNAVRTYQKGFVQPFFKETFPRPLGRGVARRVAERGHGSSGWWGAHPRPCLSGALTCATIEVIIHALASPSGRGASLWEAERDVETFRVKNAFRTENRCGDSEGGLWVESVQ